MRNPITLLETVINGSSRLYETFLSYSAEIEVNLPFNNGEVAAGLAKVRYIGTKQWFTLGYHKVDDDNQFAAVLCRSLGFDIGHVSNNSVPRKMRANHCRKPS